MGAIGASAFIFRDVVKYILPTTMGLLLFVPLLVPSTSISAEGLALVAIILGFVIYPPVATVARAVHGRIPCRWLSPAGAIKSHQWCARNWDYSLLWGCLDKDEREYLYLTLSYLEFYQISGFYLLAYACTNLGFAIHAIWEHWAPSTNTPAALTLLLHNALAARTEMFGGWQAPSTVVTVLCLILATAAVRSAVVEYEALFGREGAYVSFAKAYQRKGGHIATAIWGRVEVLTSPGESPPTLDIRLLDDAGVDLSGPAATDDTGYFQIPGAFSSCLGKRCTVAISTPSWEGERVMQIADNSVPEFEVAARPRSRAIAPASPAEQASRAAPVAAGAGGS